VVAGAQKLSMVALPPHSRVLDGEERLTIFPHVFRGRWSLPLHFANGKSHSRLKSRPAGVHLERSGHSVGDDRSLALSSGCHTRTVTRQREAVVRRPVAAIIRFTGGRLVKEDLEELSEVALQASILNVLECL